MHIFRIHHFAAALLLSSSLGVASCAKAQPNDRPVPQDVRIQPADDSIFHARIDAAKAAHYDKLPIGERVVAMGKLFLGTPYVAGTLDQDAKAEHLVVDLRGLDCVTFYENSLAFARVIRKYTNPTLADYEKELTYLRYRDGKRNGFSSRLNYSTDYFYNNAKKGVFANVTQKVGGKSAVLDTRPINFMSTHRTSYKQLAENDSEFEAVKNTEAEMAGRHNFWYIPKSEIAKVESGIQTGDILGITTNINGLDCSHTGIAVRESDGRIHFMHASSLKGKVIMSDEPLADYLTHSSHQTGIVVNRPLE